MSNNPFVEDRLAWLRVHDAMYHENPDARVGDEIQTTAVLKYFKIKNITTFYKNVCKSFNSVLYFPDNLVQFVNTKITQLPKVDFLNIWVWSPLLQDRGIYTELQNQYDPKNIKYDCVFIPCMAPEYNEVRGINPDNALAIHNKLKECFKNSIMIIDHNKKFLFESFKINDDKVIFSNNIETTFKYIDKSEFFVGCDTGTSHYAGAINHPRMTLLYPDESVVQKRIAWQHEVLKWVFDEPDLVKFKASTFPCCNPKNYKKLEIDYYNSVPPKEVIDTIKLFT